jgi:hypothetical protein
VEIPPRQQSAIDRFVELASIGAAGILSQSEHEHLRSLHIVTEFESIGRAATAIPQITQMRKYLDATDLDAAEALVPARIDSARTLATERELLKAQLRPENLFAGANAMESLRERFQKFKWSFAQFFRAAHSQRQREISELSILADQTTKYLDALRRLDGIPQLGPPQSSRFELPFSGLLGQLVRCESTDALAAEIDPRCNSCGFAIGSASPRAALIENSTQIRDALSQKLAKLSQKAIARLIREHDTEHRLEGFLKITQAAQADALTNLIDDELVAYLSEMLKHWTLERSVSSEKKLHAGTAEKVAMVPGRFPKAITKRKES